MSRVSARSEFCKKISQQVVFGACQLKRFALPRNHPPRKIHFHFAESYHLRFLRRGTAQQSPDARQQLPAAERFHHIVVGADFEQQHFIHLVTDRAEHDQRRIQPGCPDLLADFHSAQPGHAQIDQEKIGFEGQRLFEPRFSVARQHGTKPFGLEHEPDRVPQRRVVIDNQDRLHIYGG